jgi:hypothetical protein
VLPDPKNESNTISSSLELFKIAFCDNATGFCVGCNPILSLLIFQILVFFYRHKKMFTLSLFPTI